MSENKGYNFAKEREELDKAALEIIGIQQTLFFTKKNLMKHCDKIREERLRTYEEYIKCGEIYAAAEEARTALSLAEGSVLRCLKELERLEKIEEKIWRV